MNPLFIVVRFTLVDVPYLSYSCVRTRTESVVLSRSTCATRVKLVGGWANEKSTRIEHYSKRIPKRWLELRVLGRVTVSQLVIEKPSPYGKYTSKRIRITSDKIWYMHNIPIETCTIVLCRRERTDATEESFYWNQVYLYGGPTTIARRWYDYKNDVNLLYKLLF